MPKAFRWPLPEAEPESVGMSPERLRRIEPFLRRYVDDREVAGIVAVLARRDRIVFAGKYGWLDIEADAPMRFDAIFRLFSMTKIVTTVAALMLFEEGAFLLDDAVALYLPEFKKLRVAVKGANGRTKLVAPKRAVTIHDLLTHLGGLDHVPMYEEKQTLTLAEWLPLFCEYPLLGHPGEVWRYSSATDVVGRLIEVISGQPLDVFFRERIFQPLGMTDTDFWIPPDKRARLAVAYGPASTPGGALQRLDPIDGKSYYFKKPTFLSGTGGMIDPTPGANRFCGGLVSTAPDYLRFAQMLTHRGAWGSKQLLSPLTVDLMTADHLPPGHPPLWVNQLRFGLGVGVLTNLADVKTIGSVGEFGWGGAVCTRVWMDPREQMVTLIMLQYRPLMEEPLGPVKVERKFKVLAYQAIAEPASVSLER